MRMRAESRTERPAGVRARRGGALAGLVLLAVLAAGCGSGGSSTAAVRHFESGHGVERITRDLEAIDEGCRVAAGPDALRAARDLGGLIDAGPEDTYGPPGASQTLAALGHIAARKAACAHTPELRAALRRLAGG